MADGFVREPALSAAFITGIIDSISGVSEYNNQEVLPKFTAWIEGGKVLVDEDEINEWALKNPQPIDRDAYLGQYADTGHGTEEEPYNALVQGYARDGLSKTGHHGLISAMGVPASKLPHWDDIQLLTAQLHHVPLLDEEEVGTEIVIGPKAKKALEACDPPLCFRHEFWRVVAAGKDRACARGRNGRNGYLFGRRGNAERGTGGKTRVTFMSSRRPGSVSNGASWIMFKLFISKAVRARRPAPGGIFQAQRSKAKLPKCAA